MRIRPYRQSDWNHFLTLESESIGRAFPNGSISTESLKNHCKKILTKDHHWKNNHPRSHQENVSVLETDSLEYAGHLWLCQKEDQLTGEEKCWIMSLAVKKQFRRQGLGKLLIQHAVNEAKKLNLETIGLSVDFNNHAARKLYEQEGFNQHRIMMQLKLTVQE